MWTVFEELRAGARSTEISGLFDANPKRAQEFTLCHDGLWFDYSKTALDETARAALVRLAEKYGGTVVLKGAGTLVSSSASVPVLCTSGNPGMASPGMGDVLTGIVAALLGQGLDPEQAAAAGVEFHARAGDRAAVAGERGLVASDLMEQLRAILNP